MAYGEAAAFGDLIDGAGHQSGGEGPVDAYQHAGEDDGPQGGQGKVGDDQPKHGLGVSGAGVAGEEHTLGMGVLAEEHQQQVYGKGDQEYEGHPAEPVAQSFLAGGFHGIGVHDVALNAGGIAHGGDDGLKNIGKLGAAEDDELQAHHGADGAVDGLHRPCFLQQVADEDQQADDDGWGRQKVADQKLDDWVHTVSLLFESFLRARSSGAPW